MGNLTGYSSEYERILKDFTLSAKQIAHITHKIHDDLDYISLSLACDEVEKSRITRAVMRIRTELSRINDTHLEKLFGVPVGHLRFCNEDNDE